MDISPLTHNMDDTPQPPRGTSPFAADKSRDTTLMNRALGLAATSFALLMLLLFGFLFATTSPGLAGDAFAGLCVGAALVLVVGLKSAVERLLR